MPEVLKLCDRVSILGDGKFVGTVERAAAGREGIVHMIIGRSVEEYFPRHMESEPGPMRLSVQRLSSPGKFRDLSFDVPAGEICGFAGLVGAGRSEIAKAIFGLDSRARGTVEVDGRAMAMGNVHEAMHRGI